MLGFASYATTQRIDGRIGRAVTSVDRRKRILVTRLPAHRQRKPSRRLRMLGVKSQTADGLDLHIAPAPGGMYDVSEHRHLSSQHESNILFISL